MSFSIIAFFNSCNNSENSNNKIHNYEFTINVLWDNYDPNADYSSRKFIGEPERVTLEIRFPNSKRTDDLTGANKQNYSLKWTSVGDQKSYYSFIAQSFRGSTGRGTGNIELKLFKDGQMIDSQSAMGSGLDFIQTTSLIGMY